MATRRARRSGKTKRTPPAMRGPWVLEALESRLLLDSQLTSFLIAPVDSDDKTRAPSLAAFDSADQLQQHLVSAAVTRYQGLFGQPAWDGFWWGDASYRLDTAPSDGGGTMLFETGGTNVQVGGVDEGDFAKTDGRYLYHVGPQDLAIVDLRDPLQLQIASRIPLDPQSQTREIYVLDHRLTVISQRHSAYPWEPVAISADEASPTAVGSTADGMVLRPRYRPTIEVTVYDITDPAAAAVVERTEVEGQLLESRMVGSVLYLVMQDSIDLPVPATHCSTESNPDETIGQEAKTLSLDSSEVLIDRVAEADATWTVIALPATRETSKCVFETRDEYVRRLEEQPAELALPTLHVVDGSGTAIAHGPLAVPEDIFRIVGDIGSNLVSIVTLDVADEELGPASSTGVFLDYVSEVYVTPTSVYLAGAMWSEWLGQQTSLTRFALSGTEVQPVAIGSIAGMLLNQFSLDEYGGYLRAAVTQGWGTETINQLYVLQETDGRLDVVGQLPEGLAAGERIFAARFLGDRAFLVTFRQVDPLYSIDLSDPTTPQVRGELKIPGFSNYLQMIGEDLLLGLGRDADEQSGWAREPQLSLFDVSDPLAPSVVDQLHFGSPDASYSEAFFDHRAISYFPSHGVVVVPVETATWRLLAGSVVEDLPRPRHEFRVFQVDATRGEEAIELLGTIAHESTVRRSFEVDGNLITVSTAEVQVHPILSPTTLLDSISLQRSASDDHFWVEAGSSPQTLEVLANDRWELGPDFAGISSVTPPSSGSSVAITPDGRALIYTPAPDFTGTDVFEYTVSGESADVQVHVERYSDLVRIRLEPTDTDGIPIRTIEVGQEFHLRVLVEDLRGFPTGVFGAYLDVSFDAALAKISGAILRGADYVNGVSGSIDVSGLIDELGGFASFQRLGDGEHLLASIPFVAVSSGTIAFSADAADQTPSHDIGLYDRNEVVASAAVEYAGVVLEVIDGFRNPVVATDANNDGLTTPVDALNIINYLNAYGSQPVSALRTLSLPTVAVAEGENSPRAFGIYYDVNGDQHVTPADALLIINSLNATRSALGEGEMMAVDVHRPELVTPRGESLSDPRPIVSPSPAKDARPAADWQMESSSIPGDRWDGDWESILDVLARIGRPARSSLHDIFFSESIKPTEILLRRRT